MRHANISTMANMYGAAMNPSMREATEAILEAGRDKRKTDR